MHCLKSDNYHLGKFLSTLVTFFLPLHFRLFFMRSSTSFLFTQFPCTAAKTSWRDVQIMIINVGFSVFFFFFTTAVCWFVGSTTFWPPPHPPPAQHLLFFPLLLVCVFLLVRGLSFGGCGVEDKSQWKWCWMKRRQETGLWGRAGGREKGGPL